MLYLRAFSECERILDVDAQVPNGALDFRMAEQGIVTLVRSGGRTGDRRD
jgi:hypothetical protein